MGERDREPHGDLLTGLPDRALLRARLERALSADTDRASVAVLVCELDRFAVVNDTAGQQAGDELICAVAHRLETSLRAGDMIARTGGDEFMFLREDVGGERGAIELAERLIESLAVPFAVEEDEVFVSASIGVAVASAGESGGDALLSAGAAAMSRAKRKGGGRYELFDDRSRKRTAEHVKLEGDLRRGLDSGELLLHYQPLVSLSDGAICGVEALVRWNHPQRGVVAPSAFLPVAEASGLILPLSRWVLREALRQLARWEAGGTIALPYMSVNLAGRHLAEPGLAAEVENELLRAGIAPERLGLELTETVLMEETSAPAAVVQQLKDLGVRVLLDDFGTGYSSLNYLKSFPLDAIKLDRTFVAGVAEDGAERHIVRSVVSLAHALGLEVIAEGVESHEQSRWLASLGCGIAQGFAYARPAPAEAIEGLLRAGLPPSRRPHLAVAPARLPDQAEPAPALSPLPGGGPTVSVSAAADSLGVSANTLRRWADSGRITAIRTAGGHRRFEASELRRLGPMVDDRPSLRTAPVPSTALPALDELLAERGVDVAAAAANAIYEGPRLGWFRVEASRASVRAWELGLRTAARSGDYAGAVSATGRLVGDADFAGASLLERHAFVERYGELSVRLLQRSSASRVELLDVRRLFVRLRESVLEGGG